MRLPVLLLLAGLCFADKWLPFGDPVWKSPDGRYQLAAHRDGSFSLRDGDRVLAEGTLPQLPYSVHVLAREPGAVLFEKYGGIGWGDTLALLGADGKLRWRLALDDAIPGGRAGAEMSVSSIWWPRAWWVDEPRGMAVLVARNGKLSEVDLATGKAAAPAKEVVLAAFDLAWARDDALEVAVELGVEGLRDAAGKLLEGDLPADTRLRAAIAIESAGGPAVTRKAWRAAIGKDMPKEECWHVFAFAARHVKNLDLVEDAAARKDDLADEAIRILGERHAAASLAGLVTNASVRAETRAYAAQILGQQPADAVVEAIDKEMEDADAEQGGALLAAAIATGAPDLERRLQHHESTLLKVLDKETADLSWLAGYFKGRPTSEAVQPLVRSLARHKHDPALRRKLIAALKPCSGEDFGDDADAWISALAKRR